MIWRVVDFEFDGSCCGAAEPSTEFDIIVDVRDRLSS